jgi:hypothetical protein
MNKPKPRPAPQPATQESPLPTGPAPDLQTALFELQEQLELFGMARALLEQAQARTDGQLEHWKELSQDQAKQRASLLKDMDGFFKQQTGQFTTLLREQAEERQNLLESVKESQQTASCIAGNLDGVVTGLVRLKEQVKEAGFPEALDRLQAQIKQGQNSVKGLEGRLDALQEHLEATLHQDLRKVTTEIRDAVRLTGREVQSEIRSALSATATEQVAVLTRALDNLGERVPAAVQAMMDSQRQGLQTDMAALSQQISAMEKRVMVHIYSRTEALMDAQRKAILILAATGGICLVGFLALLIWG